MLKIFKFCKGKAFLINKNNSGGKNDVYRCVFQDKLLLEKF